jgi:hypothetical protein
MVSKSLPYSEIKHADTDVWQALPSIAVKNDTTCQLNNILALQTEVSCVGFEFFTVTTVKGMFSECGTLLFGV